MKKLIILISLLLFASTANAIDLQVTDMTVTIAWDASILLDNGNPVPSGDTVSYQTYYKRVTDGLIVKYGDEITETTKQILWAEEGSYFVGVSAIRTIGSDPTIKLESVVSWSNDPAVTRNSETFGIWAYSPLTVINGLHRVLQ